MRKRLSYSWLIDPFIGFGIAVLIIFLLFIIVWLFGAITEGNNTPFSRVLELSSSLSLAICFIGFVVGFGPVIKLRVIPKILYMNNGEFDLNKKVFFKTDQIVKIEIKQIGFSISHLIYYELTLSINGQISTQIIVDRMNIINYLKNRYPILDSLRTSGLSENRIKYDDYSLANKFGFKDEINKTNANTK